MANMAVLNTVYNHYLTTYAPKSTTQYDTHKKSELRSIYNSIVKQNKEAPLCIVDTTKDTQQFAVGIKESARELRNTIASLGGLQEEELLGRKIAYSSNENLVTAEFVGDNNETEIPTLDIQVQNLATPQYNTGNYLPADEKIPVDPDVYSFDIKVNDTSYEFQFNIKPEDTNSRLQTKLANLINNADIGLQANVLSDGQNNSSLRINSLATGLAPEQEAQFVVSDDHTSKRNSIVGYLGIGDITRNAENSKFLLNGNERSTQTNHFTVEKTYELNLVGISSDENDTATVGVKTDTDSLKQNIVQLVGSYNSFIQSASSYLGSQPLSNRLVGEINGISNYYHNGLGNMGLNLESDGSIQIDTDMLDSVASKDNKGFLEPVKEFTNTLLRKANQVSLNPMNYVNKTVVAYKNPGKNFSSPYVTSAYSGMMFNSYC